jgi:beta-lactamase regulating signal transducer with metallopeptidase domain
MNESLPGILLACTLRGTALIAIAAIAGPLACRLFGRNAAHWLWIAILPALLWPLPPQTPLSLQNLWPVRKSAPAVKIAPEDAPEGAGAALPVVIKIRESEGGQSPAALQPPPGTLRKAGPAGARWFQFDGPAAWWVSLWLAGVAAALAQLWWRWRRTMRMLRDARPVTDRRGVDLLRRFRSASRVTLVVTSCVRAPALAGIWRPRILIPEGWLEELPSSELESVLLHELGHYVRGDLVWEWLFAVARCLHWMNPAVWLAERLARSERELACDAWALERSASPARYGEALLEALKRVHRCPAGSFGVVAMADDVRQIARRLKWISRYQPSPRWTALLAWIPAALALAAVGSDPIAAKAKGAPAPDSAKSDAAQNANPVESETAVGEPLPLAKRSVEVTMRILRLPESLTKELGWPVADEESKGIQRVFSRQDFQKIIAALRSAPGVELLPAPRLISRNGFRGYIETVRGFRFGDGYKTSVKTGLWIPKEIETVNLGMTVEWQADIRDETTVHLHIGSRLASLLGFKEADGKLTKPTPPPAGTDWAHRMVACDMPPGAGGDPAFSMQNGRADLDLTSEKVAIVFGFRDPDRTMTPGALREETMVNYFAVQMRIAP